MSKKKKIILVGLLICAVVAVGTAAAYTKIQERNKDKLQIEIVNKYLGAYRKPDLAIVKELVSSDMKEALPGDQKAFKGMVESAEKSNGKIKDWKVNASQTNEYVGQTMVDVTVNTSKTTYSVYFDIAGDEKQGWKIRAVKEAKLDKDPKANMGGMGQAGPGQHGIQ